jgi:hypothetical protein
MPTSITEEVRVCRDPSDPNFGGYVINCHRETKGEALWFVTVDNKILPMLDGYAIIPIEKYQALTVANPEKSPEE